jgi:hypothetical protein
VPYELKQEHTKEEKTLITHLERIRKNEEAVVGMQESHIRTVW